MHPSRKIFEEMIALRDYVNMRAAAGADMVTVVSAMESFTRYYWTEDERESFNSMDELRQQMTPGPDEAVN